MKNKIEKNSNLVIYQTKRGKISFRGDSDRETIWGNLKQIAELFSVQVPAISKHLKNIYKNGELRKL